MIMLRWVVKVISSFVDHLSIFVCLRNGWKIKVSHRKKNKLAGRLVLDPLTKDCAQWRWQGRGRDGGQRHLTALVNGKDVFDSSGGRGHSMAAAAFNDGDDG